MKTWSPDHWTARKVSCVFFFKVGDAPTLKKARIDGLTFGHTMQLVGS